MSQREAGGGSQGRAEFPMGTAKDVDERPPAPGIDITKPHVARMYDYYLGGKHNYAADRAAAEQIIRLSPHIRAGARANRRFLAESVRWLVREAGVRQFIDIGSGLPTQQNVHEVAQAIDKDARVVYVDNDPLVRVHAEVLLAADPNTVVVEADVRDPKALLDRPEVREHLDFTRPIGLLLVAVLHFVQENAHEIVRTLCDALPTGSYVAISHGLRDESHRNIQDKGREVYSRSSAGVALRTREEIARFFDGLTMVGGGLGYIAEWSIDGTRRYTKGDKVVAMDDFTMPRDFAMLCGLARIDR